MPRRERRSQQRMLLLQPAACAAATAVPNTVGTGETPACADAIDRPSPTFLEQAKTEVQTRRNDSKTARTTSPKNVRHDRATLRRSAASRSRASRSALGPVASPAAPSDIPHARCAAWSCAPTARACARLAVTHVVVRRETNSLHTRSRLRELRVRVRAPRGRVRAERRAVRVPRRLRERDLTRAAVTLQLLSGERS